MEVSHEDVAEEVQTVPRVQQCELLSEFGLWTQGALALLCFSTLILKRYRELPRRPWTVFILDSSKQLTGAFTIHLLNLFFARVLSDAHTGDPCNWYWINIMVDCSLGVLFLYLYLRQVKRLFKLEGDTEFGFYGDPPLFSCWLKQILLWQGIVCAMKLTMVIFMFIAQAPLQLLAHFALVMFNDYPELKLMMVMIGTPFVMNTIQLWVTDNFIKKQKLTRESPRSASTMGLASVIGDQEEGIDDEMDFA
eukprot:GHVQ01031927.1.p1 GENE.GHVQ01031927.1~~GHVQ01031927.1.p1  ORF type:complete len:250 (+),score=28.53 GHVQ01031927.1:173-922(+)